MKLRTLIYGLLGLTVLLLAARFSLLWQGEQTARHLDSQQVAAERIAEEASRLLVVTQDNLLYANERSAQQWRALYTSLNTDLDRLVESESFNPAALQDMRATLQDLQQIFDRLQVVRGQLQGTDRDAAIDILRSRLVQALRQVSDQSFAYAVEVSAERIRNRERERNLVLAVNTGLLVVVLLMAHLLLRRVLRPLQRLAATAQQVQEGGALAQRVNYSAPDEMGLAAKSFDAMLQRLSDAQRALENAVADQRREREVLASIIEGTNVGTWEWNVQTGETRFNERWAGIIGRRLIDLQPTDIDTWTAHAHPDDLVQSGALLQAHFNGLTPYYECEARMRHRDGHWVWVLDRGRVFTRTPDGQPEWMYGTHQDITARKTLELSLRRNEAFLARVGEVAGVGGAEYDPQHHTVRWSEEWRRILEVAPDYVPTPEKALDFIEPAYRPRATEVMRALLKHGQPFDEVAPWITARGRRIWVRSTGEPVFTPGDPPVLVSVVASIQDVTAEREAREALAMAKAQAEVANQAKSQFLANMSHELRTPLNALLGIQRLLADSLLDARQREWLSKANSAGRALLGVINDVLDLARIEAGEMPLVESAIRPLDVAHSITDVYELPAQTKGLQLRFEADPGIPSWVMGDPDRLRQALANLVGNAIKFTAQGEVVLHLQRVDEGGAPWLRWSVIDTGPGIEAEALQNLFQPFVQADPSITRRFGGTGLGLSIVKQLATLMQGRAWAESEPGVGSRFHFQLPLRLPAAEEARQAERRHRPLTVVLHLPDAAVREALQARLLTLGWACSLGQPLPTVAADRPSAGMDPVTETKAEADLFVLDAALGPQAVMQATEALHHRTPDQAPGHCLLVGTAEEFAALDFEGIRLPQVVRVEKPTSALGLLQAALNLLANAPGMHQRLFKGEEALALGVCWLSGVRLLVVDDNEINRKVAAELLRDQGATCHTCENGQEALDWLAAHPAAVDAVLMDVQMPVLDGLSACRHIKASASTAGLPVLGLTAGVLASEREAGLAAGMDGFLSKPIVPGELVRQLRDTVARASGRPVPVALDHKIRPPTAESDWPAFPGIDLTQARINTSHSPQLYQRLLRVLLNQYRRWSQEWSARAERPDDLQRAALQASLHRLRGSAATLGATELAAQALEAEHRAAQPGASLAALVAQVSRPLQALLQPLARWQAQLEREQALLQAGPLSRADLRWLHNLSMLLSEHYLDAVEWVTQGDQELIRMFGGERAAILRSAIDVLDFDTALRMVQAVLERADAQPQEEPTPTA